jgi:hypothetical protein
MKIEDRGYSKKEIESNVMMLQILDVIGREEKYGSRSAYSGPYFARLQKEGLIDAGGIVTDKGRASVAVPVKEENDVYSIIKKDSEIFVLANDSENPIGFPKYKA